MPDLLHQRKKIYTRKSRPPSEQAKPSEFARTQKDDAFFSCCRPEFKEHRLPLALLHPVFGNFIEDCKSVRLTSKDVVTARNLKTKMCQFYVNEHQRRADLNNILYEYGIPAKAGAIGSTKYETDGHIEHYGRPSLISEVKLEMCGSSNGEPSLQALLYYHCFVRENALWKDMSTSPCFIIFVAGECCFSIFELWLSNTTVGPHIGFGGCALTDRPTMEIFSLLPLDFHSTNGDAYDAIARHLLALKKSVNVLTELYSQMNLSPVGEVIHSIFPYKTGFTHLVDGQLVPFSYDKERTDGRFLFNGKSDCGLVCIKFIPRYGKDVHDWCAKQLIAPKLLGFEVLAGGWVMVVMELLDQSWIPLFKHPGHPNIDNLMEAIRSHVVRLHQNHMVHGDIRDTNIMVKRSGSLEFMLVDFDWAGTAGEVHYPRFLNTDPELGRPADVDAFLPILPSHDILMVGRLIC